MDEYLAMIKIFAGNFAPRGYMLCQGQLLNISSNSALYSLLGTVYGGNGTTTFGLPDLRGRIPVGTGQGAGIHNVILGEVNGAEYVTITQAQMPAHNHPAQVSVAPPVNADSANTETPEGTYMAISNSQIYTDTPGQGQVGGSFPAQATIGIAGGSQPLPIRNPYLGMNYIICTMGLYPSRN
ncbi:phage tail protein [Adhaeribacter soli]|uniref:Phage tail protein n=1 Tax=Adhaeribacter soli TaxID=2607655 RepID=A0A5N1IZX8_9BACT|nr:tail fiber protein [Adhaeribacter soli]KAA9339016.1 phage tail protein [Adhaeribacter soli]